MHEVDLTNCDREPIHVIGHVQPHGALMAIDPTTLAVVQASTSVLAHFGLSADAMLGRSILDFIPARAAQAFEDAVADEGVEANPTHFGVLAVNGRGPFHLVAHTFDGALILEAEPADPADATDYRTLPRRMFRALQAAEGSQAFYDAIVQESRLLTGFDRVMLYRFGEDGTGVVVAESAEPHLEPYLGLNYPASDVPQQARRLFAMNTVRLYPDVSYDPAPLVPTLNPLTNRPLDLTHCVLRGVSSMHTGYLQNMGVKASMALAITQGERLWGLVALHSHAPRVLPYPLRAACELLAGLASTQVVEKETSEGREAKERRREVLDRLIGRVQRTPQLPSTIVEGEETILDLVDATGAALVAAGEVRLMGETPSETQVRELVSWLNEHQADPVWAIEERATRYPEAVGLLSVQVSRAASAYVFWFRPETAQTVSWAGDPNKPVEDDGALSPRRSFAVWRQEVAGRSRPLASGRTGGGGAASTRPRGIARPSG